MILIIARILENYDRGQFNEIPVGIFSVTADFEKIEKMFKQTEKDVWDFKYFSMDENVVYHCPTLKPFK